MSWLSNIASSMGIGPQTGLNMLRGQIQSKLGFEVNAYELHYNAETQKINFYIQAPGEEKRRNYPYQDDMGLGSAIVSYVKNNIDDGSTIDYVKVEYTRNASKVTVYFRDPNNEKQFLSIDL